MAMGPIIKSIDKCGRISIPKGIRESLRMELGENVGIMLSDDSIIIKKIPSSDNECIFCGITTESKFKDVPICTNCVDEMYAII